MAELVTSAALARSVVAGWLPKDKAAPPQQKAAVTTTGHRTTVAPPQKPKETDLAERLQAQLKRKRQGDSAQAKQQQQQQQRHARKRPHHDNDDDDDEHESRTRAVAVTKAAQAPAEPGIKTKKKKSKNKKAKTASEAPPSGPMEVDGFATNWSGPVEEENDDGAEAEVQTGSKIRVVPLDLSTPLIPPEPATATAAADAPVPAAEGDADAAKPKKVHTGARPPWAKKRTRSHLKNIRKDNRPPEKKPTYIKVPPPTK